MLLTDRNSQQGHLTSWFYLLCVQVEGYMGSAREVCVALMKAILSTGLLTYADQEERQTPEAFDDKYLANPVYMLKVRQEVLCTNVSFLEQKVWGLSRGIQ
jgi:hypothetical protein